MLNNTNRFAGRLDRYAQSQVCTFNLLHEEIIVTNVARTNEDGVRFSVKTGADVFTIWGEYVNKPGKTVRLVGKGTIARQMAKVDFVLDATIIRVSGDYPKGASNLDENGRPQRTPVVYLEGDVTKGIKAFEVVSLTGAEDISEDRSAE